jgi:hypothetical protein
MNKDFTIVFTKMDEKAQAEAAEEQSAVVLSGDGFVELDELAELRRLVAEIAEPDPLSFTTT